MYLYLNNLRELSNFGCRTTGNALGEMLEVNNTMEQYDALESAIYNGAWSNYARPPIKDGGIIPRAIYNRLFKIRNDIPKIFHMVQHIDKIFGGTHDYITNDPDQSVKNYRSFIRSNPKLSTLQDKINESNGIIINGEGTLIFGRPTQRDALYLLFVIALAKILKKPVYLLNAMVTSCPYNGEDETLIRKAIPLLKYCKIVALRESYSYEYVASLVGEENIRLIPDALFTWGPRIRYCAKAVRQEPRLCIAHPDNLQNNNFSFERPYICVSGSSSAWRYKDKIQDQFANLINALKSISLEIFCIETCDGDSFLREVAKRCNVFFLPKQTPIMAAMGVLGGAQVYITGRYHPAIMASANGVPCTFLTSNSHKTASIQKLLGYKHIEEYPVCPTKEDVTEILKSVRLNLDKRDDISPIILSEFECRRNEASAYLNIIESTL